MKRHFGIFGVAVVAAALYWLYQRSRSGNVPAQPMPAGGYND